MNPLELVGETESKNQDLTKSRERFNGESESNVLLISWLSYIEH